MEQDELYCTQCKRPVPKEVSDSLSGLCPDCFRDSCQPKQVPVPVSIASKPSNAPTAQPYSHSVKQEKHPGPCTKGCLGCLGLIMLLSLISAFLSSPPTENTTSKPIGSKLTVTGSKAEKWPFRKYLPKTTTMNITWNNVLIYPNVSRNDLHSWAKEWHVKYPNESCWIYDDDAQFLQMALADAHEGLPDEAQFPYPHQWADKHIIAAIRKVAYPDAPNGYRWCLTGSVNSLKDIYDVPLEQ